MNSRIAFPALVLLCIAIAVAGCTAPQSTPAPATPAAQTAAPAAPASTGAPAAAGGDSSLVPTTTDTLDPPRMVTVNIEKDYLGKIHATFQGGAGLIHVKKIVVTVNRADGQVETSPLGIKVDDTAELEGTKDTDRVFVQVTLDDGKTYKIYDERVPFKPRI